MTVVKGTITRSRMEWVVGQVRERRPGMRRRPTPCVRCFAAGVRYVLQRLRVGSKSRERSTAPESDTARRNQFATLRSAVAPARGARAGAVRTRVLTLASQRGCASGQSPGSVAPHRNPTQRAEINLPRCAQLLPLPGAHVLVPCALVCSRWRARACERNAVTLAARVPSRQRIDRIRAAPHRSNCAVRNVAGTAARPNPTRPAPLADRVVAICQNVSPASKDRYTRYEHRLKDSSLSRLSFCASGSGQCMRPQGADSDEELVSSAPDSRNWRGIGIALLVIAGVCALIVTAVILLTPGDKGPRVKQARISLEEVLHGTFNPRKFNGSWVSESVNRSCASSRRLPVRDALEAAPAPAAVADVRCELEAACDASSAIFSLLCEQGMLALRSMEKKCQLKQSMR
ncbi:hypothetical protein HPB50_007713 [Hyalomma asiaticum]|uniref:Uncharacterized protein n=1 Tax=Hyalomma asiaticum TaxID=266040 RepID=A0ACB7TK97_HYAAI|nr:hypothetical protein HPB50_007713 [Hyalomma asiaticum]